MAFLSCVPGNERMWKWTVRNWGKPWSSCYLGWRSAVPLCVHWSDQLQPVFQFMVWNKLAGKNSTKPPHNQKGGEKWQLGCEHIVSSSFSRLLMSVKWRENEYKFSYQHVTFSFVLFVLDFFRLRFLGQYKIQTLRQMKCGSVLFLMATGVWKVFYLPV